MHQNKNISKKKTYKAQIENTGLLKARLKILSNQKIYICHSFNLVKVSYIIETTKLKKLEINSTVINKPKKFDSLKIINFFSC